MLLTAQVNSSAILPLENEGEFPTTIHHNTHWANFFSSSPWTDSRRYVSAVAQLFRQSIIKRKYCLTCLLYFHSWIEFWTIQERIRLSPQSFWKLLIPLWHCDIIMDNCRTWDSLFNTEKSLLLIHWENKEIQILGREKMRIPSRLDRTDDAEILPEEWTWVAYHHYVINTQWWSLLLNWVWNFLNFSDQFSLDSVFIRAH